MVITYEMIRIPKGCYPNLIWIPQNYLHNVVLEQECNVTMMLSKEVLLLGCRNRWDMRQEKESWYWGTMRCKNGERRGPMIWAGVFKKYLLSRLGKIGKNWKTWFVWDSKQ